MGIFANRAIKKDEELTFNYNVDRYGCGPLSGVIFCAGGAELTSNLQARRAAVLLWGG